MTEDICVQCRRQMRREAALARAKVDEDLRPRISDTLQIVMQQQIQRFASEYAPFPLAAHVPLATYETVLDVGCGAGHWMTDMARQHSHLTLYGIDTNPALLDHARLMARYRPQDDLLFSGQDIHNLSPAFRAKAAFDLVHVRFLKEHTTWGQWVRLFKTLLSLCKVGGSVIVTEYDYPTTNSETFAWWFKRLETALVMTGRTQKLPRELLELAHSCKWGNVRRVVQPIDLAFGTDAYEVLASHIDHLFALSEPLLYARDGSLKQEQARRELLRNLFIEVAAETFQGTWSWTTIVGTREA